CQWRPGSSRRMRAGRTVLGPRIEVHTRSPSSLRMLIGTRVRSSTRRGVSTGSTVKVMGSSSGRCMRILSIPHTLLGFVLPVKSFRGRLMASAFFLTVQPAVTGPEAPHLEPSPAHPQGAHAMNTDQHLDGLAAHVEHG